MINLDISENEDIKDTTLWVLVYDLTNRCMYYRTRTVSSIRYICLKDIPREAISSLDLEYDYGDDQQDMSLKLFGEHVKNI